MDTNAIKELETRVRKELDENIVPFWANRTVDAKGGFVGRMTNDGTVVEKAPKGLILNTRILWTFSALYSFRKNPEYQRLAQRAYDYLMQYFHDDKYGGVFWTVDWQGRPLEDKKQVYGQAFAIYALAEYYRAFADEQALEEAKTIFNLIEQHTRDNEYGGYFETFNRDWQLSGEQRLSEVDMAEKKSMNSHLHILEGYTNLYEVWKDTLLEKRLEELIGIFVDHVFHKDKHYCQLFFDEHWRPKSTRVSFGHDIEANWLLYRAAEALNKPELLKKTHSIGLQLAESVYAHGLDNNQSVFYEADETGITDSDKHWWVQVEAVVGFLHAYQLSGKQKFLDVACKIWKFIEDYIVNKHNGEWFYKVNSKGVVDNASLKISEWKCPYHNCRACIEIINRLEQILHKKPV
jgi:mannobiose 2-epimerase